MVETKEKERLIIELLVTIVAATFLCKSYSGVCKNPSHKHMGCKRTELYMVERLYTKESFELLT